MLGATVGGYLGWWLGARGGIFLAFVASIVGTGLGLYLGRRISAMYFSLLLVLLFPDATELSSQPRTSARYSLRLVDLTIVADTSYGLQLLVVPAAKTMAEGTEGTLVWLRFDPDSALAWLNAAAAILRTAVPRGPEDAIQWSPALRPLDGRGGFLLGRHRRKGRLEKDHWLAVADSAPGWQAEVGAQEADSVLRLLLALAPQSRIDTTIGAAADDRQVDRAVTILQQAKLPSRGKGNRGVAVQYVVGSDGRVEPQTFVVLLAASPRLASEAEEVIRESRFEPARKSGQPVRQLVRQVIGRP